METCTVDLTRLPDDVVVDKLRTYGRRSTKPLRNVPMETNSVREKDVYDYTSESDSSEVGDKNFDMRMKRFKHNRWKGKTLRDIVPQKKQDNIYSSESEFSVFDDSDGDPLFDASKESESEDAHDDDNASESDFDEQAEEGIATEENAEFSFGDMAHDNENIYNTATVGTSQSHVGNPTISFDKNAHLYTSSKNSKKRTFCRQCGLTVTNFERHLERNHLDVKKVRDALSYPKKNKQRREAIKLLRYEGHFEQFMRGRVIPAYNSANKTNVPRTPCAYCKGIFSRNFLSRHTKNCPAKQVSENSKNIKSLSASQTLIASAMDTTNTFNKLEVKDKVFGKMRADDISMTVKTDPLIRYFGEQYLKKHKREQMGTSCSNKMRELGRLLMEFRAIKNSKQYSFMDLINPEHFDIVVESAKRLGGYNPENKTYKAASISAHMGTSLKSVCKDLRYLLIKGDPIIYSVQDRKLKLEEVDNFRSMVSDQWTTEVSSLAMKHLNESKWQKPAILPLTQDILKFKNYLILTANKAVAALQENSNSLSDFKTLIHATLALTVLYNRRRIGDVQYTTLDTYLTYRSSVNQDEILNSLSQSEKELTKYYKRIVTGGKGSKAVVILFPQFIQDYLRLLIKIRQTTNFVPSSNKYLFPAPGSDGWIRCDTVIRKFANKAELTNPAAICSNNLRKQIATVMQIMNMTREETEQLSLFMGHTEKTHNEFYKLPQDVYQTAKISKLLILMDKGLGDRYAGKRLDEIDINPEIEEAEIENIEMEEEINIDNDINQAKPATLQPSISSSTPSQIKSSGRSVWSPEQSAAVKKHFKRHIQNKQAPKKTECLEFKTKFPHLFKDKDWVKIKTYVYNAYRNT